MLPTIIIARTAQIKLNHVHGIACMLRSGRDATRCCRETKLPRDWQAVEGVLSR